MNRNIKAAALSAAMALGACAMPGPEPELLTGRALFLQNCASCHGAAAGSVTIVAIEDGYRTPASLPFHGNETNATVRWAGAGKMASLQGKTIQLETNNGVTIA